MPQIPEFPDLRKISLDDRQAFDEYLLKGASGISELTFANFFTWRDCDKSLVTRINGNICVVASPKDEPPYWFEVMGNNDIEATIRACLSHTKRFSRLSEGFAKKYFGEAGGQLTPRPR